MSTEPPDVDADMPDLEQLEPPTTKWPTVVGSISLVYAIGGLLCQSGSVVASFFSQKLMAMGGMDIEIPPVVKYSSLPVAIAAAAAGVLMLAGAIGLLRRRSAGVARLRKWALVRMVLVILGLLVVVFTLPAQVDLQRQILDAANDKWRESGRKDLVQEFDDEQIWRRTIIQGAVWSGVLSVYPLFIGFYLSRRKITDEVRQWS